MNRTGLIEITPRCIANIFKQKQAWNISIIFLKIDSSNWVEYDIAIIFCQSIPACFAVARIDQWNKLLSCVFQELIHAV